MSVYHKCKSSPHESSKNFRRPKNGELAYKNQFKKCIKLHYTIESTTATNVYDSLIPYCKNGSVNGVKLVGKVLFLYQTIVCYLPIDYHF